MYNNNLGDSSGILTVQTLSEFLDSLESYSAAVEYGQCFLKMLHIEKNEALKKSKGNYKAFCTLSQKALEDIKWWKDEAIRYHSKIDLATQKHTVTTDASNEDWNGHFKSQFTSGRWDLSEIDLHINAK